MPSSEAGRALVFAGFLLGALASSLRAEAQTQKQVQAQGFGVERFYPSAPGGGWLVMDSLDMHGGLGGVMSLTTGYARDPLRIANGAQSLAVVSDRAFVDFGLAATYQRWRLSLDLDAPIVTKGQSGTVGNDQFTGPSLTLGQNPDTLSDARAGLDVRLLGEPGSVFRLGASAQLFIPNGDRADYDTDDTYRAMFRALFAGDVRFFTYAAHVGVHVRPLNDSPTPQSPEGSELLFGAAAGVRVPVFKGTEALIVGPEIFGATAFRSFFGGTTTALEGLLTGRLETTGERGPQLRIKLGAGVGIHPEFGAPTWRLLFAIELLGHNPNRE
jgi:hypothetical protein